MAELRDVPATAGAPPDPAVGYARLTGLLGVAFAVLLTIAVVLVHRSPTRPTATTPRSTVTAARPF